MNLESLVNSLPDNMEYTALIEYFSPYFDDLSLFPQNCDIVDLSYLTTLETSKRKNLSYPIVGLWSSVHVQTAFEDGLISDQTRNLVQHYIRNLSFINRHMKENNSSFDDAKLALQLEKVNSQLYLRENDRTNLISYFNSIFERVAEECESFEDLSYRSEYSSKKDSIVNVLSSETVDIGHGLVSVIASFLKDSMINSSCFDSSNQGTSFLKKYKIMLIDDDTPDIWYARSELAGFQGDFFYDCETALKKLSKGEKYDLILSDLELGEGKMTGDEFLFEVSQLECLDNVPHLSLFSFNGTKLSTSIDHLNSSLSINQIIKGYHKTFFSMLNLREDYEENK